MKTRDRILEVSRALFNEEGAGSLSALDIATALGISAGHLYYHFKGKPQILAELMEAHADEVDLILGGASEACAAKGANVETLWTHVHILVEEAWDARFFYREPALAIDNPALAALARRVLTRERDALHAMLKSLNSGGAIRTSPEVMDGLSRQLVTGVSFHAIALELEGDTGSERARLTRAAAQIMLPVAAVAV